MRSNLGSEEDILLGIEIGVEECAPVDLEEGELLDMELDVVKGSLFGIELNDELGSKLGSDEGILLGMELGTVKNALLDIELVMSWEVNLA